MTGELEAARRISEQLFKITDIEELLVATLRCALDEVEAEAGSIMLADPETRQLVFQYSIGEKPVPKGTAIPWDQGIAGRVFHSSQAEIVRDVQQRSRSTMRPDDLIAVAFPLPQDSQDDRLGRRCLSRLWRSSFYLITLGT